MKKNLLLLIFSVMITNMVYSQTEKAWKPFTGTDVIVAKSAQRESFPTDFKLMQLDLTVLKNALVTAPDRFSGEVSNVVISIPNTDGKLERYQMYEASNFDAELQARFPEIRSYVGNGLDDKYAKLRLAIDPRGIQTMVLRADKSSEFMEPYSESGYVYAVYASSNRRKGKLPFTCSSNEQTLISNIEKNSAITSRSSAGTLKTFRLALSCNGEYSNYFGASSASQSGLVVAQFNATIARVNGVFENDFAVHLNIVNQTTNVIYYNPTTDPYTTMNNWNTQLQKALNTTLTGPSTSLAANNAAYDVGHMFGSTGGGGNAGCIGCVCVNGITAGTGSTKGRGITSPADGVPQGDNFDIDYVAHELGHQFGANHTFTNGNEGTGVNVEVGSGVTIMGYAGITPYDTDLHSIDLFHSASIAQVQANIATKSCPTTTTITHSAPIVNAGANYSIPLSTPFVLTGSATDAGGEGNLTYAWEQNDNDSGTNIDAASAASETKTEGPNWKNYQDSSSPVRYFPVLTSVLNGSGTTSGLDVIAEALNSVPRTLNFRLTVRDNVSGLGQTNFDDMVVNVVNKTALTISVPANTSYPVGSTQTVNWTGATGANGHASIAGGANVDISFSSDNGATWTTLVTGTSNDGSQTVTLPAGVAAPYCRFMVKASANIFFNISQPFSVGYTVTNTCNTYNGTSLPIVTSAGFPANQIGVVNVPMTGSISSVSVFNNITHTYLSDVVTDISSPTNPLTFVKAYNRFCGATDGTLNLKLVASGGALDCSAGGSVQQTVSSGESLAAFSGQNPQGNWTLRVYDIYTGDNGTLNSWSIEICTQQATLTAENFGLESFSIYPNPNNGTFNIQFNSTTGNDIKVSVHDIRGRAIFNKNYTNNGLFNESIALNNAQKGIYLVTIEDGNQKEVKKIVVE